MKVIFITCIRGIISRNILSTAAFELLSSRKDLRLVIIVPQSRAAAIKKEFGGENVFVEGILTPPLAGRVKLLWVLATNLLSTRTRQVQRRAKFERDRNIFDYLTSHLLAFLGRFRFVRSVFRSLVASLDSGREFDELFSRFEPALLFATDVYELMDAKLMRASRRHGAKCLGMVRSWDNITSKTILTTIPDMALVNSQHDREELIYYGDVPSERIKVVGVPHYDRYLASAERTGRDKFCQSLGLDPGRQFILFTPPSDRYLQGDPVSPVVLDALVGLDLQVLVRAPLVGRAQLKNYSPPANVIFDQPGNSPDFVDVHLDRQADRHLADSIYHSALVITWASTMIIDAAVFNKPVILVGFDAKPRPYGRSILQYYDYDHQRHIIASGGLRLVRSPAELSSWVRRYLADSRLDQDGRSLIVEEHCGKLDGRAGERVANLLLGFL